MILGASSVLAGQISAAARAADEVKDLFILSNIVAKENGNDRSIDFTVKDASTPDGQTTSCQITWKGRHLRRGPVRKHFAVLVSKSDIPIGQVRGSLGQYRNCVLR